MSAVGSLSAGPLENTAESYRGQDISIADCAMKRVGGIRTFESGRHIIIPSIRRSDEWKAEGRIDAPDFDQLQRASCSRRSMAS